MAKLKAPHRPDVADSDYELGGQEDWVGQFGAGARETGSLAGQQGNAFRADAEYQQRQIQQRDAPTTDYSGANRALGQAGQAGGQQGDVYSGLMNFAQGPQGPSGAQAQLQAGANQSMAQNLALARSGSGFGESAGNIANAQRANASTMAATANQAAQLRAQEDQAFRQQQLQAFGQGGDIAGAQRQASLAEAGQRAGMSEFQTQSQLAAEQQRDAAAQGWFGAGVDAFGQGTQQNLAGQGLELDAQGQALQGQVAQGQTESANYGTQAEIFATREKRDRALAEQRRADRGEAAGLVGTAAGAAASFLSDERSKKNIKLRDARERHRDLY